jgi:hypothetical protein
MVPPENYVPEFLRGIFMDGLAKEVITTRNKIANSVRSFDHYFNDLPITDNQFFTEELIADLVSSAPLAIAYNRKLQECNELLEQYELVNIDYDNIHSIFDKMRFEELDVIVSMHREKRKLIDLQSNLWSRSFQSMNPTLNELSDRGNDVSLFQRLQYLDSFME